MLTKSDLQQIGNLIDKSLDKKLNEAFDKKLNPIKKDLKYLRKTIDVLVNRTDQEDVKLQKRVTKIEDHLQI